MLEKILLLWNVIMLGCYFVETNGLSTIMLWNIPILYGKILNCAENQWWNLTNKSHFLVTQGYSAGTVWVTCTFIDLWFWNHNSIFIVYILIFHKRSCVKDLQNSFMSDCAAAGFILVNTYVIDHSLNTLGSMILKWH